MLKPDPVRVGGAKTNRGAANKFETQACPPMTLGNMRELGVQQLMAYCLNDGIDRRLALSAETEVLCRVLVPLMRESVLPSPSAHGWSRHCRRPRR